MVADEGRRGGEETDFCVNLVGARAARGVDDWR